MILITNKMYQTWEHAWYSEGAKIKHTHTKVFHVGAAILLRCDGKHNLPYYNLL